MTLQLEIEGIAPPTIATRKGRMKCDSLRPGAWLDHCGLPVVVTINSAKLHRAVVLWPGVGEESVMHEHLMRGYSYIGHGTKRRWHAWLPKFLQKRICPYSKP